MSRLRSNPNPLHSMNMNNDNPYLSSFLASHSAAASQAVAPASSARKLQESSTLTDAITSSRATAVETIASVSSGQTVFVTVTRDTSPTSQVSEATALNDGSTTKNVSHVGAIAGGMIGGVVALVLVRLLGFLLWQKRQTKETRRATIPSIYANADMSEQISGKSHSKHEFPRKRN
jgi:hypothetical protein